MALRPAHCYSNSAHDRAYTRVAVRVHKRNYVGTNPQLKIRQFNMGNPAKVYSRIVDLIADDDNKQIRDNAIESSRIIINRYLAKMLGKDGYFIKIRIYPYHILRENKLAQGAGADRVSKGMSLAFGKPIGRAARIRKNQKLISVLVEENGVEIAKKAVLRARARMNCKVKVRVGKDIASIGTLPRKIKIKEEAVEEVKKKAEEVKEEGKEEKKATEKAATETEKAEEKKGEGTTKTGKKK